MSSDPWSRGFVTLTTLPTGAVVSLYMTGAGVCPPQNLELTPAHPPHMPLSHLSDTCTHVMS